MTYPVQPSSHSEAPVSVNLRVTEIPGSPQVTIRAGSGQEFANLADDVARHGVAVGRSLTELRAGMLAGAGVQSEAPPAPNQAPPAQSQGYQAPAGPPAAQMPAQGYQPPQGAYPQTGGAQKAPSCMHGTKTYLERPNKNGQPGTWRAWACPADRNDPSQCKLEYIR